MKKIFMLLMLALAISFTIFYVLPADNWTNFIYLLLEALMITGIISVVPWVYRNWKVRFSLSVKALSGLLLTILLTHLTRIIWLRDREGEPFKTEYLFKSYLIEDTLQIAGASMAIAGIICIILWLSGLSRRKLIRILSFSIFTGAIVMAFCFWYFGRNISHRSIYFDYAITSLDDMRALSVKRKQKLYIDFWHSGCGPCIKEFREHSVFRDEVDKDKVHFLFIGADRSTPGEKQRQRLIVEKYDLQGTHSFISREAFSDILDEAGFDPRVHGYKAFPHHMIIDSSGQIVEIKADGPTLEMAEKLNGN